MQRQLGGGGAFRVNDNAFRRLKACFVLLRQAERDGEVAVVASRTDLLENCVLGFKAVHVHDVAAFNARVRAMIAVDPDGIWRRVNGKGAAALKQPTVPLYEVLRKIGVRPAGRHVHRGAQPGEEDRFWRTRWEYVPASMTAKTVARMCKGHEYGRQSSAARKTKAQALRRARPLQPPALSQ